MYCVTGGNCDLCFEFQKTAYACKHAVLYYYPMDAFSGHFLKVVGAVVKF